MLSRLFRNRPGLDADAPEDRLAAITNLSARDLREQQPRLTRLAEGDPDDRVRIAAVQRLDDAPRLLALLDVPATGNAAADRLLALSRDGRVTLSEAQQWHPLLLRRRLAAAAPAELNELIGGVDDPDRLAELAVELGTAPGTGRDAVRERLLQLPPLRCAAGLSALEKASRNRDKALNRLARERLERIRQLRQRCGQQRERAAELVDALQRHHRQALGQTRLDVSYLDKLQALLDRLSTTLDDYIAGANELADFGEADPSLNALRLAQRRLQADVSRLTASVADCAETAEAQPGADAADGSATDAGTVTDGDDPAPAVTETTAGIPPEAAEAPEAEAAAADEGAAEAAEQSEAERAARAEQQAREQAERKARLAELDRLLEELDQHVEAGQLKPGMTALAAARKLQQQLPPRTLGQRLARLNRCGARLEELRDWQAFATSPKREALVSAIEGLVEQPLAPPDQARRIKQLRRDWQRLGPASRPGERELAERFDTLAEQAFEPCRAYFEAQAQQRAENLAARQGICDQLADYLRVTDWADTDIKAAERIMRTARAEWQRHHPVDRDAGRPVSERFEALQEELHGHVKAAWERNLDLKRAIVAEAQALLEAADGEHTPTEAAKALQRRWREVGPTPRRPDQELWAEFRAACDGIFSARDQAVSARREANAALQQQYLELVEELEARVADGEASSVDAATLRTLRTRFAELPGQPPRELQRRFDDAARSYRLLLDEQARAAERAALAALAEEDAGADVDHAEDLPLEALLRLTLGAEIRAGVESPAEDREQRMALQVALLNEGLGGTPEQSVADLQGSARELAERWRHLGPKDTRAKALRSRFFAALARFDDPS